jgi:hypothetical protein
MDAEGFDAYFDELLGLDTAPPAEAPQTTSATRGLGPGAAEASQTTPGPRELVPAASNPRSPARSVLARLPARSPGAEKTALAAVEKLDQFAPLRAGDPLALGGERPKPPADPEAYDPEREAKAYTRSLYDAKTREQLRADGFFSIEEVRELVKSNSVKGAAEGGDLAFTLDAELIILVDSRTNFKVFVTDDNVYTRDELYVAYPFQELGLLPEGVFARQEIGVFPPRKLALTEELEYQARDVGDDTVDFTRIEDLVGRAAKGPGYADSRPPLRVVRTKVFVGKERWKDFLATARVARCLVRSAQMQMLAPGVSSLPFLALGAAPVARAAPLALMDGEQLAQEQRRLKEREAALEQRERELRQREDEKRKKDETDQRRIREDIDRLEALMRLATRPKNGGKPNGAARKQPNKTGPAGPAQNLGSIPPLGCDSVPLG